MLGLCPAPIQRRIILSVSIDSPESTLHRQFGLRLKHCHSSLFYFAQDQIHSRLATSRLLRPSVRLRLLLDRSSSLPVRDFVILRHCSLGLPRLSASFNQSHLFPILFVLCPSPFHPPPSLAASCLFSSSSSSFSLRSHFRFIFSLFAVVFVPFAAFRFPLVHFSFSSRFLYPHHPHHLYPACPFHHYPPFAFCHSGFTFGSPS